MNKNNPFIDFHLTGRISILQASYRRIMKRILGHLLLIAILFSGCHKNHKNLTILALGMNTASPIF
jgi:uncharacterized RDD family membrane protein YckC